MVKALKPTASLGQVANVLALGWKYRGSFGTPRKIRQKIPKHRMRLTLQQMQKHRGQGGIVRKTFKWWEYFTLTQE